jgi:TRAP-type C4-dicarboxylate transport system permease small subunit
MLASSSSNPSKEGGPEASRRTLPATLLDAYTRGCALLARVCMWISVAGLVCLTICVTLQIVGRHLLNSTPTWAESIAMLLVLYVTMLGAAVGVRDAGHIGFESLVEALSPTGRRRLQILIHLLVLVFGLLMAWYCGVLANSVRDYMIPNLGVSEGWKYVPAMLSGALISVFSVEHIVALLRGREVIPAWH